jgi:hypothetical protein
MRSGPLGKSTSAAEVSQISEHGVWVLVEEHEHFIPFEQFPCFREASVAAVLNVEPAGAGHLYWPDLDVDLAVESIEHPERFPLVSRARPTDVLKSPASRAAPARARSRRRAHRE